MWNAVIVDRDYGSVSLDKQEFLKHEYSKYGINVRIEHFKTPEEILNSCKDADALLCLGNPPITKAVLEGLPNVKVVQRFGIGVNSVDLDVATKMGTLVLNMPGFCIEELAIHATGLILDLLRNISYYDRELRQGEWKKAQGPVPRNPKDLVLGLYGFGGSAKCLYKIFHDGFGTKVIASDPYVEQTELDVEMVSFDSLLKESDIISLHAPLTPETKHIFNKSAFAKMKNDSIIINISRGELIQQEDLTQALAEGQIGFAGLDVFAKEPLPAGDPLFQCDRAVLTPHSAFGGGNSTQNQLSLALELVNDVLNHSCVTGRYIANKGVQSKIAHFTIK